MNLSYWEKEQLSKPYDITVIGAGIVGLSAAIAIKKVRPKSTITILERQAHGALASSRNAGFACFGSISEIHADVANYGLDRTLALIQKRRDGIRKLQQKYGASITYQHTGGYEVFATAEKYHEQEERISEINRWLEGEVFCTVKTDDGLRFHPWMIKNKEEGHLDTGQLYAQLESEAVLLGVELKRNIKVIRIEDKKVVFRLVGYDEIIEKSTQQMLVCTNALTKDLLGDQDVTPVRNQVLITQPISQLTWKGCFHQEGGYIYFRNVGSRILIGGGRHIFHDEAVDSPGLNRANQTYLEEYIQKYLIPKSQSIQVEQRWSGILSGGSDRHPILKRISDHVVIAVRLSGMGVAIGMDIGQEAATLLLA